MGYMDGAVRSSTFEGENVWKRLQGIEGKEEKEVRKKIEVVYFKDYYKGWGFILSVFPWLCLLAVVILWCYYRV